VFVVMSLPRISFHRVRASIINDVGYLTINMPCVPSMLDGLLSNFLDTSIDTHRVLYNDILMHNHFVHWNMDSRHMFADFYPRYFSFVVCVNLANMNQCWWEMIPHN